jgi:hypothetical protein
MPISIYSVRSYSDKSLVYYGFTKQPLHKRLYDYRSRYKRHLKNCDNFLIVYEVLKQKDEYILLEKLLDTNDKTLARNFLYQIISENECLNKKDFNILQNDKDDNLIENNEALVTDNNQGTIDIQPSNNSDNNDINDIQKEREQLKRERELLEQYKRELEEKRMIEENKQLEREKQLQQEQFRQEEQRKFLQQEQLINEKLQKDIIEQERLARLEQEQAKQEQAKQEQARLEKAKQEQARLEKAKLEQARLEQARLEKEQARLEQERLEQAKQEQAKQEINKASTEDKQEVEEDKNKYIKKHKSFIETINKNNTIKLNKEIILDKKHKPNKYTIKVVKY